VGENDVTLSTYIHSVFSAWGFFTYIPTFIPTYITYIHTVCVCTVPTYICSRTLCLGTTLQHTLDA
jgi:hypothetical protein